MTNTRINKTLLNKNLRLAFVLGCMVMFGNAAKTVTTAPQPTWKPITNLTQTVVTQPVVTTPVNCLLIMPDPANATGNVLLGYNGDQLITTPVQLPINPNAVYPNYFFNITPLPTAHQYTIQDGSDTYMLMMPPPCAGCTDRCTGPFCSSAKAAGSAKICPKPIERSERISLGDHASYRKI